MLQGMLQDMDDLRNMHMEVLPQEQQQAAAGHVQPPPQAAGAVQPPGPDATQLQAPPAGPADTASAGVQTAAVETDAGPSASQQPRPPSPHHRQPAAWQQQLSSGISFGGSGSHLTARGNSVQAPEVGPAGPAPPAGDTQQGQYPATSSSGHAIPFTGRAFRLDGGDMSGAGATAELEGGDEATSVRRTLRQRLPARWAGASSGPE